MDGVVNPDAAIHTQSKAFSLQARLILLLVIAAEAAVALDVTLMNVALPSIGKELGLAPLMLQWVPSAYTLALGGLLIVGGRLSDMLGERICYMAGCGVFAAGTLACALAHSFWLLIAARILEGVGAAFLMPAALALIVTAFPSTNERLKALPILFMALTISSSASPVLAGWLISHFGWNSIFLPDLTILPLSLIAALYILPAPTARSASSHRIDIPGVALATSGITLLLWSLATVTAQGRQAPLSNIAAFLAGLGLLGIFTHLQRRSSTPLIPPSLLKRRNLIGGILIGGIVTASVGSTNVLVNMSLQRGLGLTPLVAGLTLVPSSLSSIVMGLIVPRISKSLAADSRLGLIVSMLLIGGGNLVMASLTDETVTNYDFLWAMFLIQSGAVLGYSLSVAEIYSSVDDQEKGVASALLYTGRMFLLSIGVAVTLSSGHIPASQPTTVPLGTFAEGYQIAMSYCLAGLLIIATLLHAPARPRAAKRWRPW